MTYIVYTCYDASGSVLYVGATVRGDTRIEEHARYSPWFADVELVTREEYETATEASERERELIGKYAPSNNRSTTPYGHTPPVGRVWLDIDGDYLPLVEASEISGLSPNTLRAQIKNGVLPARLVGKTYVVRTKDLDRYILLHKGKVGRPRKPRSDAE